MYKRNGFYYADFMYKGQRYVKSLSVSSKSVAKELEDKFKTEVRSGEYQKQQVRDKNNAKFNDAMDDYLQKESILKKSHKRDITSSRHLKKYFGNMTLAAITPENVTEYKLLRRDEVIEKRSKKLECLSRKIKTDHDKEQYRLKKEATISFATINRELSCLQRVYNWYNDNRQTNIVNPIKGKKGKKVFFREQARERVMTEGEEEQFFTIGKPKTHVRNIIYLLLNTGMRIGEVLKLKKEDVHIGDIGGKVIVKDTKNGETRKVPLTKELTIFLKEVISISNSDYVFSGRNGKPYTSIKTAWNSTCKRAGIAGLLVHDLKHTFTTRAEAAGVNPFTIARIVGHKDRKTTMRYTNPTDDHLLEAMSKITKKSHHFSQQEEIAEPEEVKIKVKTIAPVAQ